MKQEKSLVILEKEGKTKLLSPDSAQVLQGERVVEPMLELLARDDNPVTRQEVAKAIPSHDSPETRELLEELAKDENPKVRQQAQASKELLG